MTTKRIETVFWIIITFFMLLTAIAHPRIIYWILFTVCVIKFIVSCRIKKKKTVRKLCIGIVVDMILILIICDWGQSLNFLFPYHASYEYKKDIMSLKEEAFQEYYYFPDEIPEKASKVKWMCLPSFMQGSGYHKLFFYTDEAYLEEIYTVFAKEATIYTYEQYAWINKDTKQMASFPGDSAIEVSERKNVEVFMLYDNNDINHLHNGGFYINQKEGYICFFAQ